MPPSSRALVLTVAFVVALTLSVLSTAAGLRVASGCTLPKAEATPEPLHITLEAVRWEVTQLNKQLDRFSDSTAKSHQLDQFSDTVLADDDSAHLVPAPAHLLGGAWTWKHTLPPHIARSASWFERERTLGDVVRDTALGQVVWITFANLAFVELVLNWVAHVYRLRKERQVAIAALDAQVKRLLVEEGVPCIDMGMGTGIEQNVRGSIDGFRRVGYQKALFVLRVLETGRHALVSDADVVWLSDPEHYLASTVPSADVGSATDCLFLSADRDKQDRDQNPYKCGFSPGNILRLQASSAAYNTGIMFFRASLAARMVVVAWSQALNTSKDRNVDDNNAFNRIVWFGQYNHPNQAIRRSSADGRVINISTLRYATGSPEGRPPPSGGERQCAGTTLEALHAPPCWWAPMWPNAHLHLMASNRSSPMASPITSFQFAPLSARHFCSGHTLWVQQESRPHDCFVVHCTFTEAGLRGKVWRLREAGLWLLDPPKYFGSKHDRYMTYTPPEPERIPPDVVDATAALNRTDQTGTGWLTPDAIALSPRLRAHLRLMRRNLHALRDAFAIAASLNRTLLLPHMHCVCDRDENPRILPSCTAHASGFTLPFKCPLDYVFSQGAIQAFLQAVHALPLPEPGSGHPRLWWAQKPPAAKHLPLLKAREHSFLSRGASAGPAVSVLVVSDEREATIWRDQGKVALVVGSSDGQTRRALAAVSSTRLLQIQRTEGVFGGWDTEASANEFEEIMAAAQLSRQRPLYWCCSSWDKPWGMIEFALPPPTRVLQAVCSVGDVGAPGCDATLLPIICDASSTHSWYQLDGSARGNAPKYRIQYPRGC